MLTMCMEWNEWKLADKRVWNQEFQGRETRVHVDVHGANNMSPNKIIQLFRLQNSMRKARNS